MCKAYPPAIFTSTTAVFDDVQMKPAPQALESVRVKVKRQYPPLGQVLLQSAGSETVSVPPLPDAVNPGGAV